MKYVVFDIDGVIARPNPERMKLVGAIPGGCTDWEAFYSTDFSKDEVIKAGCVLVKAFEELSDYGFSGDFKIVFLTSRRERIIGKTDEWLCKNVSFVERGCLLMRGDTDEREAHFVKLDLLREAGITPDNTLFVVDDDITNVSAFSEAGFTALLFKTGNGLTTE